MASADTNTDRLLRHARQSLSRSGVPDGAKEIRQTSGGQRRLLKAANCRSDITGETEVPAAQEDFAAWLDTQRGTLTDDFEIGL
jgi:hypothetical protein